jgi:ubiquinone/menaquinone biosynthesis C-methylase UbiE
MPNYGDKSYWEERYKSSENTTFDWLENYSTLKDIISSLKINKETGQVLNLGCGNSEFAENMYCDGYKNIKNIDISHNVIKSMSERNKGMEGLTYEVMDVRELKYDDNSFDLAVDKSTIDALLCGEDAFINVAKMIKEVQRVLKVGGYYMIVSYGSPEYRVLHLNRKFEKFKIEILKIEKDFVEEDGYDKHHYIYLCQKLEGADEISQKYFDSTLDELIKQQILEEEAEEQEENDKEENKEIKIEKTKDINKEEIAKNVFIQNENDARQTNMGTSVKIELSKKDKTENKTKDEDSKVIADIL